MSKINFFLLLLVGFSSICFSKSPMKRLTWDEFVDMVEEVPDSGKYDFIKRNYLRGYELAHTEYLIVEELNRDSHLALSIFTVISEDTGRDIEKDIVILTNSDQICFPLPIGCIDSGDGGIRP